MIFSLSSLACFVLSILALKALSTLNARIQCLACAFLCLLSRWSLLSKSMLALGLQTTLAFRSSSMLALMISFCTGRHLYACSGILYHSAGFLDVILSCLFHCYLKML
jgi:hypothetical protein